MWIAILYGNINIVKFLHSIGIECNTRMMSEACYKSHLDIIKYFHEIGIEYDKCRFTTAIESNNLNVIKLLYETSKVCIKNTSYYMDYACKLNRIKIARYIAKQMEIYIG
jgi:hypothetical protein